MPRIDRNLYIQLEGLGIANEREPARSRPRTYPDGKTINPARGVSGGRSAARCGQVFCRLSVTWRDGVGDPRALGERRGGYPTEFLSGREDRGGLSSPYRPPEG
jgi:hypothetical protein